MALESMTSIFQPAETKKTNGLAEGKGLSSVTNAGSEINIDDSLSLTNGLAQGKGLETLMDEGSDLNIDEIPVPGTGLANGTGLVTLGVGASALDIDGLPNNISDGLAKQGENK